jgi:hypothetical protein
MNFILKVFKGLENIFYFFMTKYLSIGVNVLQNKNPRYFFVHYVLKLKFIPPHSPSYSSQKLFS